MPIKPFLIRVAATEEAVLYHYNFYLTDPQIDHLRDLSARTGMAISEHLRRAADAYLAANGYGLLCFSGNVAALSGQHSFAGRS